MCIPEGRIPVLKELGDDGLLFYGGLPIKVSVNRRTGVVSIGCYRIQ